MCGSARPELCGLGVAEGRRHAVLHVELLREPLREIPLAAPVRKEQARQQEADHGVLPTHNVEEDGCQEELQALQHHLQRALDHPPLVPQAMVYFGDVDQAYKEHAGARYKAGVYPFRVGDRLDLAQGHMWQLGSEHVA